MESPSSPNMRAFFTQYPGFIYNPSQPATSEFRRLSTFLTIHRGDAAWEAAHQTFANALGNQFGEKYGVEMGDLGAWQRLCQRIGMDPVPSQLHSARNAVQGARVNIIDLIDDEPGQVPTFPTKKALLAYSKKKIFPKRCATIGPILSTLLNGNGSEAVVTVDDPPNPGAASTDSSVASTFVSMHIHEQTIAPPFMPTGPQIQTINSDSDSDADEQEILPLRAFFLQFAGFEYQPTRSATSEFRRLCRTMEWKKEDPNRAEAYIDWSDAMADQFGRKYGVDMDDLGAWQRLCQRLEIDPIPDDLEEARETVFNTHVNLIELVDEGTVRKFPTEMALSAYSKKKRKIYPSGSLRAGDILTSLLRYIEFPPPQSSRRTSRGVLVLG